MPRQFGHTFGRTASVQSRQNVHSYEQIIASVALGASGRLQFSHVGRSSSMLALRLLRGAGRHHGDVKWQSPIAVAVAIAGKAA
jgi:hypothetical protein